MTYRNGGLRHIYYSRPVEEMNLPPRALNAFKRTGIITIGQLFGRTIEEILDIRNIGAGTIGDILAQGAAESSIAMRVSALEQRVDELEVACDKDLDDVREELRREIREEVANIERELNRLEEKVDDNEPPF